MMNKKLISLVPDSMKFIVLTVLANWISLLFHIASVFSIAYLIESLFHGTITAVDMLVVFTLIAVSIGIRYAAIIKSTAYSHIASCEVKNKLRTLIYNKLLNLGISYDEKLSTSHIVQISGEGVEQIEVYFSKYLPQLFYSILAPLTLFSILSFIHLRVSLVLLVCVPLIPLSIIAVNKISKRLFHKYWSSYTDLGDGFIDNLGGLVTLKIYQDDAYYNDKMNENAENFRKITMSVLRMQLNSVTLMDLIAYGGAAVGIIFTLMAFSRQAITLSQAVTFILLASEFFIPLRLLGSFFHIAMNGMAAAEKIMNLLALDTGMEKGRDQAFINGDIEISNLSFGYTPEIEVLKDISLHIPQNSFISIVGESGCGKSTIAALLMGFHKNFNGSIKINHTPVTAYTEKSIMQNMCIIRHQNYLFKGTVRENLLIANKEATDTDLYHVLKKVNLYDFIMTRGGLDFILHENASNLSGGQVQRLALARALLHDASIYIFDEATSNIDIESENTIHKIIMELSGVKTVILISHRLANVVASDTIFVLKEGRLVEQGDHHELLQRAGTYSKLYTKQKALEDLYTGGTHCA
ncbi:ABC transporter ATP-binding protein/permease [Geosporobacter ferrireducens]|uniref:Cysteine ABC transporter ATP-binding protein n=1 Tax=Geosporobacter ferrireducens TaxID=1424294 RepID=A0A1D8GG21_9FIRM|nr:ABC transporter ATP-binding protein/permease [Geosporobacter ferrireducens]AOT69853.1 cysteine ABC transporter ATP-binding protein [Geosporobacter ferrireducens]MTI54452.1 ABC transporter ATP-binding protein/permease [Geosporobacter ferrireducens]